MLSCTNVVIDLEGRYVFILCSLFGTKCVIAEMYNPPPFSAQLFRLLVNFMARHFDLPLLAVGDFTNYLDFAKDKLPATVNLGHVKLTGPTPFARLLTELGLTDVWRMCNPNAQEY